MHTERGYVYMATDDQRHACVAPAVPPCTCRTVEVLRSQHQSGVSRDISSCSDTMQW